jgi:hypothetical protein
MLPTPLSLVVAPGSSVAGLALVVFLLLFGGGCLVPVVVLAGRSGRLASAYLTGQLGRPVHIRDGKLGIRWWQHRVDQEMLGA